MCRPVQTVDGPLLSQQLQVHLHLDDLEDSIEDIRVAVDAVDWARAREHVLELTEQVWPVIQSLGAPEKW